MMQSPRRPLTFFDLSQVEYLIRARGEGPSEQSVAMRHDRWPDWMRIAPGDREVTAGDALKRFRASRDDTRPRAEITDQSHAAGPAGPTPASQWQPRPIARAQGRRSA
jgi:hypothetical protein